MKLEDKLLLAIWVVIIVTIWFVSIAIHFLSDEYLWVKVPLIATEVLMAMFWILWFVDQMPDEKTKELQELNKKLIKPLDKPNENP